MRLRDLLDVPELALRLVVGDDDALDSPVRWTYSSDLMDPRRYLLGGELVITGLVWRRTPADSEEFVANLARAGALAIAAGTAQFGSRSGTGRWPSRSGDDAATRQPPALPELSIDPELPPEPIDAAEPAEPSDVIEPAEAMDASDPADPTEPIEPLDATEQIEANEYDDPMDSTEFDEPIDRIELCDHNDHRESPITAPATVAGSPRRPRRRDSSRANAVRPVRSTGSARRWRSVRRTRSGAGRDR